MKIYDDSKRVYVRQSWLGDAMICMERGRLQSVMPEFRTGSDATIMGTAVHAAIEQVLSGAVQASDIGDAAVTSLEGLMETETWKQTNIKPETMKPNVAAMAKTWVDHISHKLEFGGLIEHHFNVDTERKVDINGEPYELWFSGTMDYIEPNGTIWDWKTAARKYSQSEKQKQSIQASVYALSAVIDGHSKFDVQFNFGVMTRAEKSQGQIVPVQRTSAHAKWVVEQAATLVQAATRIGYDNPWLKNDQHFLCSQTWCPWWSVCKGAYVSDVEQQWSQEAQ